MAFGPKLPNGLTYQEWEQYCEKQERYVQPTAEHRPKLLVKRKQFLSGNETAFLARLKSWFPEVDIHCQVQLMRLVEVDNKQVAAELIEGFFEQSTRVGHEYKAPMPKEVQAEYWRQHNMFNLLSCDFVLTDPLGVPLCVIELDGDEHTYDPLVHQQAVKQENAPASDKTASGTKAVERTKGWDRDLVKDLVLRTAGIPLLRVENDMIYTPQGLAVAQKQIRETLDEVLSGT